MLEGEESCSCLLLYCIFSKVFGNFLSNHEKTTQYLSELKLYNQERTITRESDKNNIIVVDCYSYSLVFLSLSYIYQSFSFLFIRRERKKMEINNKVYIYSKIREKKLASILFFIEFIISIHARIKNSEFLFFNFLQQQQKTLKFKICFVNYNYN